ncbi:MAG: hypothetical protein NVS9B10_20860 [Nevskia sp.]
MARRPPLTRRGEVERIRRRLEQQSSPRLQMALIVAVTASAGGSRRIKRDPLPTPDPLPS